jgi:ribosome-associated protein
MAEIEFSAIRASGPGGQHVNKISSAIQLRFDVNASSLLEGQKQRILEFRDSRISDSGVIVIKAQNHRSQERNKSDALDRLKDILAKALKPKVVRRPTRPSQGAVRRRLKAKTIRSEVKSLRGKVRRED